MPFDVRDTTDRAASGFEKSSAAADQFSDSLVKLNKMLGTTGSDSKATAGAVDSMAKKVGAAKKSIKSTADAVRELGAAAAGSAKPVGEFAKEAEKLGKTNPAGSVSKTVPALNALESSAARASSTVKKLSVVQLELARLSKDASKAGYIFSGAMRSGAEEAKRFAGSLGGASGSIMAVGVASAFLLSKFSSMASQFKASAVSLASFNVELKSLGNILPNIDSSGLESMRNDLDLTREQAKAFFAVLETGVMSGVASATELGIAAGKLKDAFGGDQTERLKQYVDLLREIPTIETDLKVTTSGDASEALFALAKKGQINGLIELREAGLAGGDAETAAPDDVKMLNTAQASEKTMADIKDFLVGTFFPAWGMAGLAAVAAIASVGSAVSGGVAMIGGVRELLSSVGDKTDGVRSAVDAGTDQMTSEIRGAAANISEAVGSAVGEAQSGGSGEASDSPSGKPRRRLRLKSEIEAEKAAATPRPKLKLSRTAEADSKAAGVKSQDDISKRLNMMTKTLETKRAGKAGGYGKTEITNLVDLFGKGSVKTGGFAKTELAQLAKLFAGGASSGGAMGGVKSVMGGLKSGQIRPDILIKQISAMLKGGLNQIGPLLKGGFKNIGPLLKGGLKGVLSLGKSGLTAAKTLWGMGAAAKGGIAALATFAGIGLQKLGDSMVAGGSLISGSLVNMGGALMEYAGTIAGFATLGSAIPVLGTAVGAAIGAIVGLPKVIGSVGKSFTKLGDSITTDTGGDNGESRYNESFQAFGAALSRAGNFLSKASDGTIKVVKSLGKGIWTAVKTVVTPFGLIGAVAKAFELIPGPVGRAAASFNQWVVDSGRRLKYSKDEVAAMRESEEGNQRVAEALEKNKEGLDKVADARKKTEDDVIASAQQLQIEMQAMELAFNNAKTSLYDFEKEVAGIDLGLMAKAGGGAAKFSNAIDASTSAVVGKFALLSKASQESRSSIMQNAKLQNEQRSQALMNLHKLEMKAAEEFIDGMGAAIDALFSSPALQEAKKKRDLKTAKSDLVGSGATMDEFGSNVGGQQNDAMAQMAEVENIRIKMIDIQKKREDMMKQTMEETTSAIKKGLEQLPNDVKSNLGDMSGLFTKGKGIDGSEIIKPNLEQAEKSRKAFKEALDKTNEDLGKVMADMPNEVVREWAKNGGVLKDNLGKARSELKEVEKDLQEAKNDLDPKAAKKLKEKLKLAGEKVQNAEAEQKKLNQEIEEFVKTAGVAPEDIKGVVAAFREGNMEAAKSDSARKKYEEILVKAVGADKAEEIIKKQTELAKKRAALTVGLNTAEDIIASEKKTNLALLHEELKLVTEAAGAKEAVRNIVDQIVSFKGGVAEAERAAESAAALADAQRGLSGGIAATADAISAGVNSSKIAYDSAIKRTKMLKDTEAVLKAKLEGLKKLPEAEQEARAVDIGMVTGSLEEVRAGLVEVDKQSAEAAKSIMSYTDAYGQINDALNADPAYAAANANLEYAASLTDMASMTADGAGAIRESAEMSRKAIADKLAMEEKAIQDASNLNRAAIESRAELAGKDAGDKAYAATEGEEATKNAARDSAYKNAVAETTESLTQLENARVQSKMQDAITKAAKAQLDTAKQELAFAERSHAIKAGELETALDIATVFDGSGDAIKPILAAQLEVERERLASLEAAAAKAKEMAPDSQEAREAELNVIKQQVNIRKTELDNVKKLISARTAAVDLEMGMLEEQMSFLSEFGGSFGQIMDLQGQMVDRERERLALAQEQLDAAKAARQTGLELRQAEAAVQSANIALQRKTIGAQKSMMDRMLGSAFGQLRSQVGGAKNRGSDVGVMGVDKTRVMGQGGIYLKNAQGGNGTIADRQARLLLGGSGQPGSVLGTGAKKSDAEAQLDGVRATEANTASIAKSSKDVADSGTTPGSLYTHDIYVVTALGKLNNIMANLLGVETDSAKNRMTAEDLKNGVLAAKPEGATSGAKVVEKDISASAGALSKAAKTIADQSTKQEQVGQAKSTGNTSVQSGGSSSGGRVMLEGKGPKSMFGGARPAHGDRTGLVTLEGKGPKSMFGGPRPAHGDRTGLVTLEGKGPESMFGGAGSSTLSGGTSSFGNPYEKSQASVSSSGGVDVQRSPVSESSLVRQSDNGKASGGGGSSPESVQVSGEMAVHFDNQMFKDMLVPVVLKMLMSPDAQQALSRSGFVNKNV